MTPTAAICARPSGLMALDKDQSLPGCRPARAIWWWLCLVRPSSPGATIIPGADDCVVERDDGDWVQLNVPASVHSDERWWLAQHPTKCKSRSAKQMLS